MKTMSFPQSHKENEFRRAIVPEQVKLISHPECLYFESGYGEVLGISDQAYQAAGANVVSRDECLEKDIICDPKIGDADYLPKLSKGQTIFGWVHATQNRSITDILIDRSLTAYAWENMNYKGRHIFWQNNELAGEAAVLHAFQCYGELPYGLSVAVIGRGNTATGVVRALNMLGAKVMQYNRRTEQLFRDEIGNYDVIVNCVLWDITRTDHIISRNELKKMKHNSMIIDVSCDRNGGIETSVPTTIDDPTYVVDGVVHYVVDHTPAIFYKTFSKNNSKIIYPYIDDLINGRANSVLEDAHIMEQGSVIDQTINEFQHR